MKPENRLLFDELDRDLRICFLEEWKAGLIKEWNRDYFRPTSDIMLRTLGPFIGGGNYDLALIARFSEKTDRGWRAQRVSTIMTMGTTVAINLEPPEMSTCCVPEVENPTPAHAPCSPCRGLGIQGGGTTSGLAVPPEALNIHDPMVQALQTTEFHKLRDHRAKLVDGRLCGSGEAGIFQILFKGYFMGFGSEPQNSVAMIHYPVVWNFPVYLDQSEADSFGIDPNIKIHAPWLQRCETCRGAGYLGNAEVRS